ncbi:NAD(P)-dependent alcohol dehydrogenase [bacterium]|nr:NAD(P)-dependent alcohol dehydrogenase [bacterium]
MKALLYNKKASPHQLIYCDTDKPTPSDDEVLVKIIAVSLNAADYRSMKMRIIPKKKIFGADIAGCVESVGKNIRQFKPGDDVLGDLADYGFGGLAEYALAPERLIVHKPAALSFENAAALPMAAVTALQALRDKGNIQKGHEVLIIGCGGGVGTYAVQLAKYFGATVTGVCSAHHVEQTYSLGADVVIDYTKEDFTKTKKWYDIILAVNGNYSVLACRKILKPNGIYVAVGGALSQISKSIFFGWTMSLGSKKIRFLVAKANQKDLEFIVKLAENEVIKPVIDRYCSLDQAAEAMSYARQGHSKGKVVIKV